VIKKKLLAKKTKFNLLEMFEGTPFSPANTKIQRKNEDKAKPDD
jgi:hypothetical protein